MAEPVGQLSPDARRMRLYRYLKKGGVLVRDMVGGTIGVRWAAATRTGVGFDAELCERRLASGRLEPVPGSHSAFRLPPPTPNR